MELRAFFKCVGLTEDTVKGRKLIYALSGLILLGVGITIAGDGIQPEYKPTEKAYYLSATQASFVRPGLKVEIQKVELSPLPNVNVTFRLSDDQDQPLDRLGIQTPGVIATQFILARIKPGDIQYSNYFSRSFTNAVTGAVMQLPATDTTGAYTDLGNGVYRYTFGNKLPANIESDSTHTLGIQAARDLTAFDMGKFVANTTFNFVPSGAPVTQVRDVVRIENCNQCHDPLALHGGNRIDTKLCILCHQPQNTDPPTNNSLDFKVYIHKIHMGANLPSVSGKPLNMLGTSGSPVTSNPPIATGATQSPLAAGATAPGTPFILGSTDYSQVIWPQDVRNCTTCHQKGSQSDNWKTNPNRAACGSCHDNINFATGDNHPGGVQLDDTRCTICHKADTGLEFDLSVAGVHTMPWKSKQLKGLKVAITGVTNANPASNPAVSFTVTDNSGNPVALSTLARLYFTISGPTSDYAYLLPATGFQGVFGNLPGNNPWQENALTATAGPTGYTYTFTGALPSDASGTWAIGAEAYRTVTIRGSLVGQSLNVRESIFNPVSYFSVDGSTVVPRRTVVAVSNCNACHETLAHHGNARKNTQYCVLCHNPNHVDNGTPPSTVNFRTMIMGIHMSRLLDNTYTINTTNYNGLRFPGDQRDCAKCHVDTTYTVPLPDGLIPTIDPTFFFSPLLPTASACLGCHNGADAAAHAFQMTAPFGESCPVCHEEGADFAVTKVHAR
jgi:OmcA/MtrC family decaheme c-type cytochrome